MLVEEGRVFLADPVAKYIPEWADPKVGVEKNGRLELVAAERAITIQDLLRHTSGLTYAFTGDSAVQRLYKDSQLFAPDPANAKELLIRDLTTAEFVVELAKLPLIDQPGASWYYSHSTDVVGRVVEIVGGQPLSAFLDERIFRPLGMKDTARPRSRAHGTTIRARSGNRKNRAAHRGENRAALRIWRRRTFLDHG